MNDNKEKLVTYCLPFTGISTGEAKTTGSLVIPSDCEQSGNSYSKNIYIRTSYHGGHSIFEGKFQNFSSMFPE